MAPHAIFASPIASYPERWRDGPCETLATCESKVPIPAASDRGEMSSCVELTTATKGPERSGPFVVFAFPGLAWTDEASAFSISHRRRRRERHPSPLRNHRPPRGPHSGLGYQEPGRAHLPDLELCVRFRRARGPALRPGGARKHLHPDHEPHPGRVGDPRGPAGGRHRQPRGGLRAGGHHLDLLDPASWR